MGSRVKKGQLLATLASETVVAEENKQKALVAQANANLEQARSNDRRARVVGQGGALSEQQREDYRIKVALAEADLASARAELQSTRIRLGQTRIVAVDDGIISARTALLGKVLSAGDELFRMVRDGRIEWQAELDARQLAQVQPGQVARMTLPGGQSLEGRVRLVSPTLNTKTSRGLIYVSLPPTAPPRPACMPVARSSWRRARPLRCQTLPSSCGMGVPMCSRSMMTCTLSSDRWWSADACIRPWKSSAVSMSLPASCGLAVRSSMTVRV